MKRRLTATLLCLCLLFTLLPAAAFAAEEPDSGPPPAESTLCEHHPQHDESCGYTEGSAGTPCAHEHSEDCYAPVTNCVHQRGPACYPADPAGGTENAPEAPAAPAEPAAAKPTACTHVCSVESGCITQVLDCRHAHDAACGYVCEICDLQEDGEAEETAPGPEETEPEETAPEETEPTEPEPQVSAGSGIRPLATTVSAQYRDAGGELRTCPSATVVENSVYTWESGWYVVQNNVGFPKRIVVRGDVHLILSDGSELRAGGGINVSVNDSLTICVGDSGSDKLVATAVPYASGVAGIGSVTTFNCGNITINGGTVTATSTDGAGIGSSAASTEYGGASTFSTEESGDAVIFASSITDQRQRNHWKGVIFEGSSGWVYGNQTLTADLTVPEDSTLTIPADTTLTVSDHVTLTNEGTVNADGTGRLQNNGTIDNYGTLPEKIESGWHN